MKSVKDAANFVAFLTVSKHDSLSRDSG